MINYRRQLNIVSYNYSQKYKFTHKAIAVESHQIRQQQIIQVQDEIHQHNVALLEIIQKLGTVREELDLSLTQAKVELKSIKYAKECNCLNRSVTIRVN